MQMINKILIYGCFAALIAGVPPAAAAQRGGQPTRPQQGAAKPDTGKKSTEQASVGLDFQDQDLKSSSTRSSPPAISTPR